MQLDSADPTNQTNAIEPPKEQELTEFWRSVWSELKMDNENGTAIKTEKDKHQHKAEQGNIIIIPQEIAETIRHIHNWKCPGIDYIQHFWYKQFTSTNEALACQTNKIILQPDMFPKFLTQGTTQIKLKNSATKNPTTYRSINCLPTLYYCKIAPFGSVSG